jgi:formate dehydrogenase iron-sulfur subunit
VPAGRGLPEDGEPSFGFFTDTTLCIGCKACEVACKQWNQLPADGFHFTGHSYDNTGCLSATTWRHVAFLEQQQPKGPAAPDGSPRWLMLSDVCKHCEEAPCVDACPTGALLYNELGSVYLQNDICNGCAYCVAACPFGVLERATQDGHAHKCTFCYDRQKGGLTPACAKACPTESIQFGPLTELRTRARQRVAELHARGVREARLYGEAPTAEYSALHAFFLLTDRPGLYNLPEAPTRPARGVGMRYALGLLTGALLCGAASLLFARGE